MAMVQHLDLFAGEDREITLSGRDSFNLPIDLTGRTVDWRVGRSPYRLDDGSALLSKTGTVIDPAMGVFTVQVVAGETVDMEGDYEHMATAYDSASRAVICHGRFRIRPVVLS